MARLSTRSAVGAAGAPPLIYGPLKLSEPDCCNLHPKHAPSATESDSHDAHLRRSIVTNTLGGHRDRQKLPEKSHVFKFSAESK